LLFSSVYLPATSGELQEEKPGCLIITQSVPKNHWGEPLNSTPDEMLAMVGHIDRDQKHLSGWRNE
jgi:hypothetical protein